MTQDPVCGPYVRGKLELAGLGLNTPLDRWLDAVYAVWLDAPHDRLEVAFKKTTLAAAKLRPDRSTWGKLPEHQALTRGLMS